MKIVITAIIVAKIGREEVVEPVKSSSKFLCVLVMILIMILILIMMMIFHDDGDFDDENNNDNGSNDDHLIMIEIVHFIWR